jgi:glycosyltransferase involved in cell wall biosynthesis
MPERVSVIVPVLDRASLVGDTLESILAQTRHPDEIIVTDDGSTDGTLDVLARYREHIRLVHTTRAGPSGARNAALKVATGDLIGFLDSDDLWPADSLARQLEALASDPSADAVCGISETVLLEGGRLPMHLAVAPSRNKLVGSVIFRNALLKGLKGFNPILRFGEDHELLARASAAGARYLYHDHLVLIHRRHAGNLTNDPASSRAWFEIARLMIRRRRAEGAGV